MAKYLISFAAILGFANAVWAGASVTSIGSRPVPIYANEGCEEPAGSAIPSDQLKSPAAVIEEFKQCLRIDWSGKAVWVRSKDVTVKRSTQAECLAVSGTVTTAAARAANEGCKR